MNNVYIYALVDPRNNNVFYIGYTNNPERRLNEHLNVDGYRKEKNLYKDNVIRKILKSGLKPKIIILDSCEKKFNKYQNKYEHEILEINYVKKYNELGNKLTNLTIGGDGGNTHQQKVFQYSEDGIFLKEYKSVKQIAEKYNVDSSLISKIINQREKKSYHKTYFFSSKEKANAFIFKKIREYNNPIIQLTLCGKYLNTFKSEKEASIITNIWQSNINDCLNNKRKSAGGYIWKYKNNN